MNKTQLYTPLLISAVATPALIAAVYIILYSVNVPFFDQWRTVPTVVHWVSGDWSWTYLFRQYDGQRIPLQQTVAVLGAWITGWNTRFEVLVGFGLLVSTSGLILAHVRSVGLYRYPGLALGALLPVTLVLFSLRQSENLLHPWSIHFFGSTFFVTLSIFLLTRQQHWWVFCAAMIAAMFACSAFLNGFLIWPIGMAIILATYERRRRWARLFVWAGVATAFGIAYFVGFSLPDRSDAEYSFMDVVGRGLALLGGALSSDKDVVSASGFGRPLSQVDGISAAVLGTFILGCAAYSTWRAIQDRDPRHTFALALLAYGLGAVGMIAAGRAQLGLEQVLSSRYTTMSGLVLVAVILLTAEAKLLHGRSILVLICLTPLIVYGSVYSVATEFAMGPRRRELLLRWADTVKNHATVPDKALVNPHFTPDQIREYAQAIERARLSVFRR